MDLKLLREQVRKLLKDQLEPVALECDQSGEFAMDAYKALAEAGYAALYLPEEFGGAEHLEGFFVVVEEMSKISPAFAMSVMVNYQLFGYNVNKMGTDEQRKKYLKGIIEDKKIGCWALTEPDVGSDAVHIKTTATEEGDHFVVNGSKTFITNAPIADYFLIITNTGGQGFDSGTAFILEKGMEGLSVSQPFKKHGHRSSPTGQVFLDHVKVPKEQMLGDIGRGFHDMKHSLDIERLLIGPMIIGMLEALIEKSVKYASSRIQFGKPIVSFQLIQEKIARMRMHLEVIRATVEKGVAHLNEGKNIHMLANALKLYGGKVAVEMGSEAMQILGGNGYMHEYGVEMFMRDAKLLEIGGGTNEMMVQILAKNTIREYS